MTKYMLTALKTSALVLVVSTAPLLTVGAEPSQAASSAPPGAAEYAAHCAACHGAKLEGGVHAPPLVGAPFQSNWAGKRARLLYSRIISTMPQNDPGTLSPPDAFVIALYVFAANGIGWSGQALSNPNDLNTLTIPGSAPP
jgi:S-disulfanyl-L-cysteine oxidoreductase SoxD